MERVSSSDQFSAGLLGCPEGMVAGAVEPGSVAPELDGSGLCGLGGQEVGKGGGGEPPCSNTGVLATEGEQEGAEVLLDYIGCSVPESALGALLALLGGERQEWEAGPGVRWYEGRYQRGNVVVLVGNRGGSGEVHLEVRGQGCRQLEAEGVEWGALLRGLVDLGGRFSRLDLAFDDRAGLLDLDVIEEAVDQRWLTSRCSTFEKHARRRRGGKWERTVCVGSRSGSKFLRFYDKAGEQGLEGVHWVRAELELHDEAAWSAVSVLVHGWGADGVIPGWDLSWGQLVRQVLLGLLAEHVQFRQVGMGEERSRWPLAPWWERFLDGVARLKFALAPAAPTMESAREWIERQVGPLLAVVMRWLDEASGGPDAAATWLEAVVEGGKSRWRGRHFGMLAAAGASVCTT